MVKNTLIIVLVAVLLGFSIFGLVNLFKQDVQIPAGAIASPDFQSTWYSVGGVREWKYQTSMASATSTVCSFLSPATPSVLESFSATFTSVPTYATAYMVGSGTKNATTTSVIAVANIALPGSATASLSTVASSSRPILAGSTYVNMNYSTSTSVTLTASTFAIAGRCQVVFREI